MEPRTVGIAGLGLLGGSLALACRTAYPNAKIRAWARREATAERALAEGVAHFASTDLATLAPCDAVILCTPIGAMPAIAESLAPILAPTAWVTDVGSVKAPVVAALDPILGGRFLGSHPMAGSDEAGLDAAREHLFRGATCILTPTETAAPSTRSGVRAFWEKLGCRVRELTPDAHDRAVAWISHLPHTVAAALVDLVCSHHPDALHCSGPGFRDTTRVASGPPEMWAEILQENREAMRESLNALIHHLRAIDALLDDRAALAAFLARARDGRDALKTGTDR
jgi:prephenate dehydrogenase